jgi:predicted amidohydrolase YtcJ
MIVLYNGKIYTQDPQKPLAAAILVDKGRILATGNDADLLTEMKSGDQKIDLQGKTVLPGLIDSHIHFEHTAISMQNVMCETPTLEECLKNVGERAKHTEAGKWINGWGWNHNVWKNGYGTAKELDSVAPKNPVFLLAKSGHAGWANSLALQLAGVNANTPDPEGGKIQRDELGNPTGILLETASDLVHHIIPRHTLSELVEAIKAAQQTLWQMGITGLHDFDSTLCFQALQVLEQQNLLRLRVVKGIAVEKMPEAIEMGLRTNFGSEFIRMGSLKLFSDGALGPQTASMLDPYENTNSDYGILLMDSEQLFELGRNASSHGLSMAVHAIGDKANREMLDGYEELRKYETENNLPHLKNRIEHVQLLHKDDLARLAKLNIVASMQPIHATSDLYISDRYWGKRARYAYAFKSLWDLGTTLTFGSDCPVETANPFVGLHAAVTRRRATGEPGPDGWYSEERLSLRDAIKGYTLNPADTANLANKQGKLATGFYADLIVLDRDLFTIPEQEILNVKPVATMVAGEWVWQA